MIYCTATNYGKNFITYAENATGSFQGFPGDVWTTDDVHDTWVDRVGGVSKTKAEAQAIVDAAIDAEQVAWDNDPKPIEDTPLDGGGKGYGPVDIILP